MSHKVAEIKGELLDFIHNHAAWNEIWEALISRYSDIGKIHTRKNFAEKNSVEIIGITERDLSMLSAIEKFFIEKITPSGFLKITQY
jgi:hypothetical protein